MINLTPALIAAGFQWQRVNIRYVKGWPEKSPRPYRLYRHDVYLSAHADMASLIRTAKRRLEQEA